MFEGIIRRQTAKQERQLEAWMTKRQREHALPGDVAMTPDVPCGEGQQMDVFQPKDAEGVLRCWWTSTAAASCWERKR